MRVSLNKIDFEVEGVTNAQRAAILADPHVAPAIWREVFRWDHTTSTGTISKQGATEKGQIVLPNGILFYVPKARSAEKAEGPSQAMSKRVLEALGAKNPMDIMRAVASIIQVPKMMVPRKPYAPIEGAASYSLRMYTEFNVVRLRNASRNLSFIIAMPGQCIYHHEITAKDEAYDALVANDEALANIQPRFILAPTSDANRNMRLLALSAQLRELQEAIKAEVGEEGGELTDRALAGAFQRARAEYQVMSQKPKGKPAPSVA